MAVHIAMLPILLLLALLVTGVVLAAMKNTRKAGVGLLVGGGVLLLAGGGLFFLRRSHKYMPTQRGISAPAQSARPAFLAERPGPDISTAGPWAQGNASLPLEANIYPSPVSAATALGGVVGSAVLDETGVASRAEARETVPPVAVRGAVDADVTAAFISALRTAAPSARVEQVPSRPGPEATKGVFISLDICGRGPERLAYPVYEKCEQGRIEAQVAFPPSPVATTQPTDAARRTITRGLSWVRKPWVEDLGAYEGKLVGDDRRHVWYVGRSDDICSSEQEALEQARERAAGLMLADIRGVLAHRGVDVRDERTGKELLQVLRQAASSWPTQRDVFTQQMARPYGNVYRAAVLVNESQIDGIAGRYQVSVQSRASSWVRLVLSIAGMGVLITVVYQFLNAATKGYYKWKLRLIVMGVILAGVLVLLVCS
ncbi:MAG: hypothetical protein ACE15C_07265 [Phycisphaerae bacterium]